MRSHPEHVWEEPDRPGYTYWLFSAADEGHLPIIQLLVESGADINASVSDDSRKSPEGVLVTAAGEGHLEVVRWLLDRGATLNHVKNGKTRCFALTDAAGGGHVDVVKLLVDRGAAVNSSWSDMTSLDHALTYNQAEVAAYLRSIGAMTAAELAAGGE